MADTKISGLAAGTVFDSTDWLVYVDVSDTTMASTGTDKKLSPSVLVAGLPAFGASGTNHAPGVVPDPGASAGTTKFLREDATWVVPAGGGGGTGTVTSITAGTGITASPSPITAAGTLSIANSALTYGMLQNEAASTLLGNPTGSPAAPSEITLGPNLAFSGTTLRGRTPIVAVLAPATAVANTAALTSIFTGATLSGSLTIPANTLVAGSMLRFDLFGTISLVSPPTFLVQILLGGTIIGQSIAVSLTSTVTGNLWLFDHSLGQGFMVQVAGASGKIIGGERINPLAAGTTITINSTGTLSQALAQVTINTTTSLVLDIKVQWSVASASNIFQLTGGCIYLDG